MEHGSLVGGIAYGPLGVVGAPGGERNYPDLEMQ